MRPIIGPRLRHSSLTSLFSSTSLQIANWTRQPRRQQRLVASSS